MKQLNVVKQFKIANDQLNGISDVTKFTKRKFSCFTTIRWFLVAVLSTNLKIKSFPARIQSDYLLPHNSVTSDELNLILKL